MEVGVSALSLSVVPSTSPCLLLFHFLQSHVCLFLLIALRTNVT